MWHFKLVYLQAQTTVDAADIRTWQIMVILITGNTQILPIGAQNQEENGADSWIFPFLNCGKFTLFKVTYEINS